MADYKKLVLGALSGVPARREAVSKTGRGSTGEWKAGGDTRSGRGV